MMCHQAWQRMHIGLTRLRRETVALVVPQESRADAQSRGVASVVGDVAHQEHHDDVAAPHRTRAVVCDAKRQRMGAVVDR